MAPLIGKAMLVISVIAGAAAGSFGPSRRFGAEHPFGHRSSVLHRGGHLPEQSGPDQRDHVGIAVGQHAAIG